MKFIHYLFVRLYRINKHPLINQAKNMDTPIISIQDISMDACFICLQHHVYIFTNSNSGLFCSAILLFCLSSAFVVLAQTKNSPPYACRLHNIDANTTLTKKTANNFLTLLPPRQTYCAYPKLVHASMQALHYFYVLHTGNRTIFIAKNPWGFLIIT